MTVTNVLATDIGKLRMTIGDNNTVTGAGAKPDGTNFTDDQLQVVLDQVATWRAAVPIVLRILANLYSLEARSTTIAEYSEDMKQVAKELRLQANEWQANPPMETSTASMVGGPSSDDDRPMPFGMKLFDPRTIDQRSDD